STTIIGVPAGDTWRMFSTVLATWVFRLCVVIATAIRAVDWPIGAYSRPSTTTDGTVPPVTQSLLACSYDQRCPAPERLPSRPAVRSRYADAYGRLQRSEASP